LAIDKANLNGSKTDIDHLEDAIQAHVPDTPGAVLIGWTLVAEWMDEDGRWLSNTFNRESTDYQRKSYLAWALDTEGDDDEPA
jgi:hypothetical protein